MTSTRKVISHYSKNNIALQKPTFTPVAGTLLSSSGHYIPLRQYHTVGRSSDCHTHISNDDVSRIHAIIFWQDTKWHIEDKSTNGVWVNGQKILKAQTYSLQVNDRIALSSKAGESFKIINNNAPCDILLSMDLKKPSIYLSDTEISIDEDIHLVNKNGYWYTTYAAAHKKSKQIQDGSLLRVKNNLYRLQTNQVEHHTLENKPIASSINDLTFRFEVSEDEEDIRLFISDLKSTSVIKGSRIQGLLYLLLCLARQSSIDLTHGYSKSHYGWISVDNLSISLGIEPDNTRIRLHRLRDRIRNAVSFNDADADVRQLLQLQNNEVRLNTTNIVIVKGSKTETALSYH
ncbi:FHA domain-containing protein [Marinomonas agarivorans]|nr:FHA domain-containing protein [Marinomonas agarivorans]